MLRPPLCQIVPANMSGRPKSINARTLAKEILLLLLTPFTSRRAMKSMSEPRFRGVLFPEVSIGLTQNSCLAFPHSWGTAGLLLHFMMALLVFHVWIIIHQFLMELRYFHGASLHKLPQLRDIVQQLLKVLI